MDWVRSQLEARGLSQAALAEAIGLTSVQMNKVLTGYRVLQSSEADRIRHFFGYRLPEEPRRLIPVIGQIGPGAKVLEPLPCISDATLRYVEAPDLLPEGNIVAIEVVGNAMTPTFDEGDLIFYAGGSPKVTQDAIGKNCICCEASGAKWVKRVKGGSEPGLYNLLAISPEADSQYDIALEWASRILLHLPRELANIV